MTVAELASKMSYAEFLEWQAFHDIDPIGGYRGDIQAAMIAASMGGGKLSDYMIIDPNPMTDEQRQEYEQQREAQKARIQVAEMIAMFNSM